MSGQGEFCRIEERFMFEGIALHVGFKSDVMRTLYGPGGKTMFSYPTQEATGVPEEYEPALVISDAAAREVLRALSNHYGGADDTRALRRDYDAERNRVDKLTDAVIAITKPPVTR